MEVHSTTWCSPPSCSGLSLSEVSVFVASLTFTARIWSPCPGPNTHAHNDTAVSCQKILGSRKVMLSFWVMLNVGLHSTFPWVLPGYQTVTNRVLQFKHTALPIFPFTAHRYQGISFERGVYTIIIYHICMHQIITPYTLTLYNIICQLYANKAGKKSVHTVTLNTKPWGYVAKPIESRIHFRDSVWWNYSSPSKA